MVNTEGFDDFYGTMTGAGSFWDPYTLTRNTEPIETDGENYYYGKNWAWQFDN